MLPLCVEEGIGVIPWSPLARGFLAGTRKRGSDRASTEREKTDDFAHKLYYGDADFDVAERVAEVAAAKGVAPAQVALSWLLHKPGVTAPIVGASKMEQLEQAVAAVDVALTPADLRQLEEPYEPHPVKM
jgi:aryl-alcohol dehydrogenase (NADP+)